MSRLRVLVCLLFALPICAEPVWTDGTFTAASTAASAEDGNLMLAAGTVLSFSGNEGAWAAASLGDSSVLNDGAIPKSSAAGFAYSVGDNAVMTIIFPGKANLSRLRFWTYGTAGRIGIQVNSIEAVTGGTSTPLLSAAYENKPSGKNGFWYDLANADGSDFATGAERLVVTFGTMHNNGTTMVEVEVIGEVTVASTYTVTFLDQDGETIKTLNEVESGSDVSALAPDPPEVEGQIFLKWDSDLTAIIGDTVVKPVYVPKGTPYWETAVWTEADVKPKLKELNLFAQEGATVSAEQGTIADALVSHNDPAALVDNICANSSTAAFYGMGDNGSLTFTLPYPQDIGSFELYTRWGDGGRDGIEIASLSYQTVDDAWHTIALDPVSVGLDNSASDKCYLLRAYCPDPTAPLAPMAKAFRVDFGRTDNSGTGLMEARATRFLSPQYDWRATDWDTSSELLLPAAGNLLRHKESTFAFITNVVHDSLYSCTNDLSVLTNGIVKADKNLVGAIYPIGSYAVAECTFAAPKDIRGLRFWTYFYNPARDGIAIDTLYVRYEGEDFFRRIDTVQSYTVGVGDANSSGAIKVEILAPDGDFMFNRATALRIAFGELDNTCSTFGEIEVLGRDCRLPSVIFIY